MLNYIIRQTDIYLKSKSREVIKMLKRLAKELCIYILAGGGHMVLHYHHIGGGGERKSLVSPKLLTAV